MRLLRREICCLQHGETESNVWNTFVWSCPTWPSRWGMHISIDWPRLKSCLAVCDECTTGEIYSSLSRDAGCLAMWSWRESCVTKIWGSGAWSRIRVISFRYHGFPYSTIGDFLDPNIRVIRGPYCIGLIGANSKASHPCGTQMHHETHTCNTRPQRVNYVFYGAAHSWIARGHSMKWSGSKHCKQVFLHILASLTNRLKL